MARLVRTLHSVLIHSTSICVFDECFLRAGTQGQIGARGQTDIEQTVAVHTEG